MAPVSLRLMFVMVVSEPHFEQLWSKLAPENRHLVEGLPCRSVLIPQLNVLVLTDDTLIADDPQDDPNTGGISMIAIKLQLQAAKVTSRLSS